MGLIATDKNKITFIYNSNNSIGKQALGYVKSSNFKALILDTSKDNPTSAQWAEISKKLDLNISELIDKEHPAFKNNFEKTTSLDDNGWLKVIQGQPEVVKAPILIKGDNLYLIITPTDVLKHVDPDSAGIPK